jgi:putative Mg2+ transporter-C (MgtC) family protein
VVRGVLRENGRFHGWLKVIESNNRWKYTSSNLQIRGIIRKEAGMNLQVQLELLAKVALALLLGGIMGYERERADKPAGFRTYMLVSGASALLVGMADALLLHINIQTGVPLSADPIRIVESVITGISFLGAGTILHRRETRSVEGLTTAAGLLFSSGVGMTTALEQFPLAIGATVLAVLVLWGAGVLEDRIEF